jgi:hypothetical protein
MFSLRKALRFGHIEAATLLGSLLIAIVAGAVGFTQDRRIDQLASGGGCRDAQVVEASRHNSLRLGTSATLSYSDGQRRYLEHLHYDSSNTLNPGDTITICLEPGEPTTFAAPFNESRGTSTNLWLRSIVGLAMSAAAFVAFIVTMAAHQWRFGEGERE